MPELPEVEALRRSLLPYVTGQTVRTVSVQMPKLVSGRGTKRGQGSPLMARDFECFIAGQVIQTISRRAKNLIVELGSGAVVLIHLKMTGQLVFVPNNPASPIAAGGHPIQLSEGQLPNKHTYVTFTFDTGTLYYNDVRQFGYLLYYPSLEAAQKDGHFDNLGLEPLSDEFTLDAFKQGLKNKTGVLKSLFLNQKVVVGLGNIYCDEVCFAAGVRPTRKVSSLTTHEIENLYQSICHIIPKAVQLGGSSVSAYLLADGSRGNYAREHKVYGRAGKPCLVCGTVLTKIQLAGRTTVFCEHDQK